MPIFVWTHCDPGSPDVYPDAERVQEYGGHLRVWSPDDRIVIAHYAPGEWTKTLRPDWPTVAPRPWCICTSPDDRRTDASGTIPLPLEIPGQRDLWFEQRRDAA